MQSPDATGINTELFSSSSDSATEAWLLFLTDVWKAVDFSFFTVEPLYKDLENALKTGSL